MTLFICNEATGHISVFYWHSGLGIEACLVRALRGLLYFPEVSDVQGNWNLISRISVLEVTALPSAPKPLSFLFRQLNRVYCKNNLGEV